ncbi:LOW QUALITY PROTEIN: probable tubulin polyglutamylase TTLL9 [Pollicipes pollicipes]|uniref:LOW QUALITY PROTEIN: probable tubulin polyglutamylase TTLL9 n=1 Tax=Pollicipes pollicipes TaxID=41117 RepID=UPI001885530F|nr:LOW QUALITY PROTEIN: probable tubulin polyglutamylase TTLL9 [Pollicipes pollicipes]
MAEKRRTSELGGRPTIRYRCSFGHVMLDVFRSRGWKEVGPEDPDWDINWCDVSQLKEYYDHTFLQDHQRICHFRNHYELSRKNMLMKNIRRLKRQMERAGTKEEAERCVICPTSFELPSEYHMFVEEFRHYPRAIWIMKPAGKSQGRGIFLTQRLKDVTEWKIKDKQFTPSFLAGDKDAALGPETYVVQRYISNPYLIGGRKFDLRLYALVSSYTPLKVWLYREGFARFSSAEFTTSQIEDNCIHLTNVAIQKHTVEYNPQRGSKWSMRQLRHFLRARHGDAMVATLIDDINNVFIKSLQSVQKIMINDKHCFELYGYDILIDSELRPWLMEVNASPSLATTGRDDYRLKFALLDDTLHVVDLEGRLTGRELRVGGYDLIWNDGPVSADDSAHSCHNFGGQTRPNTFLGCYNDREEQLQEILQSKPRRQRGGSARPSTSVQQICQ